MAGLFSPEPISAKILAIVRIMHKKYRIRIMIKKLADSFRQTVSGNPQGRPAWVDEIANGDDLGLFGPDSAVWEVHGSVATLIGGIRALLLQAAHPAALAGVTEHSRYEVDPLGRLAGTTRWLTITSFGSTDVIQKEARRVKDRKSTRLNSSHT